LADFWVINVERRRGGECSHCFGKLSIMNQVDRTGNGRGAAGGDGEGRRGRGEFLQGLPGE
jgi:hypothetical protein